MRSVGKVGKVGKAGKSRPVKADGAELPQLAARAVAELEAQARPAGTFDASRYFRGSESLAFLNTGSTVVRTLAARIASEHKTVWSVRDALAFADLLVRDPRLEVKGLGLETLARYRRHLTPAMLPVFKRWLAADFCANWATTDTLCGAVVGPLLLAHPELVDAVASWAGHRNIWVRRAGAVALIKSAARGKALGAAYQVATTLLPDEHDLIHKATGWLLREAGRTDRRRLERFLHANGPAIPRTALRYAIEHFEPADRARLLAETKRPSAMKPRRAPAGRSR